MRHPHVVWSSIARGSCRAGFANESQGSRSAQQLVAAIAELRQVHEAFAWFRSHARELEDLQLQVTAIPAPPWGEQARSEWLAARFQELGLADVHRDELGNVFGIRPGTDPDAPYIALSAHHRHRLPAGHADRCPPRCRQALRSRRLRQLVGHRRVAGDCRRHAGSRTRQHARPSSSSAMWAKKAKATCAACGTSSSSRDGRRPSRRWSCSTARAPTPSSPKVWAAAATRSRCAETAATPGATSARPIPSSRWRA